MKTTNALLLISVFLMISCATSQQVTRSWVNPEFDTNKNYQNIFLAVLTEDEAARQLVEKELALRLTNINVNAIKSSEVLPANFEYGKVDKERIAQAVESSDADGIFTIALLDVKTEERYIAPQYFDSGFGGMTFYSDFGAYYSYRTPQIYSPGYYSTTKTYILESNLYDAKSKDLLWTVQSKAFNPSNFTKFLEGYSKVMSDQLRVDGLLK